MKKTVLLFIAFVFTYTSFAQETIASAQTLQVNTVERRKLPSVNLLGEWNNYPELYHQYMRGKKHTRTGWVLAGTGSAFATLGCYLANKDDMRGTILGILYIEAGILCLVTSAPFFISGGVKKSRAVKEFNRQYYSSNPSPYFQLNMYPDRMGIAYVF